MQFVYIKIPVVSGTQDRFHRLEDQLDSVLQQEQVGSVLGWGDSLGDPQPDGSRPVAYTRIDVEVIDIVAARAVLQKTLPILGSPAGTEIHFKVDGQHFVDRYRESAWLCEQPLD